MSEVVTVLSCVVMLHHLTHLRTDYMNISFSKYSQLCGFTFSTRQCVSVYTQAGILFLSHRRLGKNRVPAIFDYVPVVIS